MLSFLNHNLIDSLSIGKADENTDEKWFFLYSIGKTER